MRLTIANFRKPLLLVASIYLAGQFGLVSDGIAEDKPLPGESSSGAWSGRYRGYNLLFIILDTLRVDNLSCYGYCRKTSPNIDRLAERSAFFENAFIHLPLTLPSHVSIFTGMYPQNTSVMQNFGYLSDDKVTLAELFQEKGYATAAVVSSAVLKKNNNLDQGFDDYLHNFRVGDKRFGPEAWKAQGPADAANRLAISWLDKNRGRKFFLWMHYYDIHGPNIKDKRFGEMFDHRSQEFIDYIGSRWETPILDEWKYLQITNYDRRVAFIDHHIGELVRELRRLNQAKRTIIVITSDHGEGLYQHKNYFSHGRYVYEEQIKVPLLIVLPDIKNQIRIGSIVESVDIMPTVLELLGLERRHQLDGESLVRLLEGKNRSKKERAFALSLKGSEAQGGRASPGQLCVRTPAGKLIHAFGGESEFYDLHLDPFEKRNAYAAADQKRGKALNRLARDGIEWFGQSEPGETPPPELDDQTRRELKALGYIQ